MMLKKFSMIMLMVCFSCFAYGGNEINAETTTIIDAGKQVKATSVNTSKELYTALMDKTTTNISIGADFTLDRSISSSNSDITIYGQGHKVTTGAYYISFTKLNSNIAIKDLNIDSAKDYAFKTTCKVNMEFDDILFSGYQLLYALDSNVTINGGDYTIVDYLIINDTGSINVTGTSTVKSNKGILMAKYITFSEQASMTANVQDSALFVKGYGEIKFKPDSELKVNSQLYGVHSHNKTKMIIEKGANVVFNTANAFNGHTYEFDALYIYDDAKLIINNYSNPHQRWTLGVYDYIYLGENAQLVVQNHEPKIKCKPAPVKDDGVALSLSRGNARVDISDGAIMKLSQIRNKTALTMLSHYNSRINFKEATVKGWYTMAGTNLNGTASETTTNVTGYLTNSYHYTKAVTNNSVMNQWWGGLKQWNSNPYSQIWIEGKANPKPVITTDKSTITYERTTAKTEAQFLKDINAKSTINTSNITSDFATAVNMNKIGSYVVTLSQPNAVPVKVTVIIEDTVPPIIYSDEVHMYNTAGMGISKTEAQFLKDINAYTDDGSPITTNFNDAILDKVGFYQIELTAIDEATNVTVKKVITIVVHPNKSVVGKESTLYASDFVIPLSEVRALNATNVKLEKYAQVMAMDLKTGADISDKVTVNTTQLAGINATRVPQTLPLTFTIDHNGEVLELRIIVTVTT